MSILVIRDLEQNVELDSIAMQSIKGGALFVNLYDVYANPSLYSEREVQIANQWINGD